MVPHLGRLALCKPSCFSLQSIKVEVCCVVQFTIEGSKDLNHAYSTTAMHSCWIKWGCIKKNQEMCWGLALPTGGTMVHHSEPVVIICLLPVFNQVLCSSSVSAWHMARNDNWWLESLVTLSCFSNEFSLSFMFFGFMPLPFQVFQIILMGYKSGKLNVKEVKVRPDTDFCWAYCV